MDRSRRLPAGTANAGNQQGPSARFNAEEAWDNRLLTPQVNAIVKNTFVSVVDTFEEDQRSELRRSASDGDLSKSSGGSSIFGESQPDQVVGYFLPSLWSNSSNSSDKRTRGTLEENAPWLRSHAGGGNSQASAGVANAEQPPRRPKQPAQPGLQASRGSAEDASEHDRRMNCPPANPSVVAQRPFSMLQGGVPGGNRLCEPSVEEFEPLSTVPSDGPSHGLPLASPLWPSGLLHGSTASSSKDPTKLALARPPGALSPAQDGEAAADSRLPSDDNRSMLVTQIFAEMTGRIPLEKLEELAQAGVLAHIPRNATDELSSVGSINHQAGTCTPCAYWFKGICKYGICCHYCHFAHNGQKSKRLRPSKQTRMRIRRWEAQKDGEEGGEFEEGGDDEQPPVRRIESL